MEVDMEICGKQFDRPMSTVWANKPAVFEDLRAGALL